MKPFHTIAHTPIKLGEDGGMWTVPSPTDSKPLRVIASTGLGWDHVSVSRKNRTPNWAEMCAIKRAFFAADEVVMQLHPKQSEYVNNHPYCLHLWRPQHTEIPTPPAFMVGVKGAENVTHEQARQLKSKACTQSRGAMAQKIYQIANALLEVGIEMEYHAGFDGATQAHARKLMGASAIARDCALAMIEESTQDIA